MAWSTPKTTWAASDAPTATDFNRVEGNVSFLAGAEGTGALTLAAGDWNGGAPSCNAYYKVISDYSGLIPHMCYLTLDAVYGVSLSNNITGSGMPASATPTHGIVSAPVHLYHDTAAGSPAKGRTNQTAGWFALDVSGNFAFYLNENEGSGTGSGFGVGAYKGWDKFTIIYPVN